MRALLCCLALVVFCLFATPVWSDSPKPDKNKLNPDRLKGMKAAIAEIESGKLKLKSFPPPASPWHDRYVNLLKMECGIECELISTDKDRDKIVAEMGGYNDVMRAEIEHRFGVGIINNLGKKAEAEYLKSKKKK
jgi:hypothetical protein